MILCNRSNKELTLYIIYYNYLIILFNYLIMSEEFGWEVELPEGIDAHTNSMFLVSPERAVCFWRFLSKTPEYTDLRTRLIQASEEASFCPVADSYNFAQWGEHAEYWRETLPRAISEYVEKLRGHKSISFTPDEIEIVSQTLRSLFLVEWETTQGARGLLNRKLHRLVA